MCLLNFEIIFSSYYNFYLFVLQNFVLIALEFYYDCLLLEIGVTLLKMDQSPKRISLMIEIYVLFRMSIAQWLLNTPNFLWMVTS